MAPSEPLLSRPLALVFLASLGGGVSFYLLLTVVPLYASLSAGAVGAGLATGALMLSTVVAELATPQLVDRFGERRVFAAGLFLLGAPALALSVSAELPAILAVCLVRGLGFGITVVLGSAMVAALVPAGRRGEGLGLYGVVLGVPSFLALPFGVWLADEAGFPVNFAAAAIAALLSIAAVPGLPDREVHGEPPVGVVAGLRDPGLLRPAVVFTSSTLAAGVVVTFLPLALPGADASFVALALLVQSLVAVVTRWWAGRYGDRHGSGPLIVPALVVAAIGILALVPGTAEAALLGMILFGAGFGVIQNATLALMFGRVSRAGFSAVSAIWNLAYDTGLGIGAVGFGLVATRLGYPVSFLLLAGLMLVALAPAVLDARPTPRRPDALESRP